MQLRTVMGIGWLVLAVAVATTAILGPLVVGLIEHRITESMETQLIGGDVVLIGLATPAALTVAVLWYRDNGHAAALGVGLAAFIAYTFLGFILFPDYHRYDGNNEQYYPLFAGVLTLSIVLGVMSWARRAPASVLDIGPRLRRVTAFAMLLVAGLFAIAWSGQIAAVIIGNYSAEYLEHPTGFWLVRTLDFGVLIPAAVATGIGLMRSNPTAFRAAGGLGVFLTLMLASIVSMTVAMIVARDSAAEPIALAILVPALIGTIGLTYRLHRSAAPVSERPPKVARKAAHSHH